MLGAVERGHGRGRVRAVEPVWLADHTGQRLRQPGQVRLLETTTLAIAQMMPTAKIAVPNTKTCGGMPILVTP
jgi:hypothetical protein